MVKYIVRIGQKYIAHVFEICTLKNLSVDFTRKTTINMHSCNESVPHYNKTESRIVRAIASFFKSRDSPKFCQTPAVKPGSARSRAPKIT